MSFIEVSYISGETGSSVGGNVAEFLDIKYLIPRKKLLHYAQGKCRIHFVFDYYGIRYHILLEHNELVERCEENTRLNELAESFKDEKNDLEASEVKCLDLFWPFVADDSIQQEAKTTRKPTMEDRFQEKNAVKLQLATNGDGKLSRRGHSEPCLYPFREPIKNPCSRNIPVVQMKDIEFLEEISDDVFKAKLGGVLVCVKVAPRHCMLPEIEILVKIRHHVSINSPLLGLVDAGQGCIDKFILPFIIGKELSHVRKATLEQKVAWKRQISEAVSLLHDNGIAWGDGSIWNVMIDDESGRAKLIDFGLGCFEGCEGFEVSKFETSKKWDLEAVADLSRYIDNLTLIQKD